MRTDREQTLRDRIASLEEVLGQDQDLNSQLRDLYGLERLHAQMLGMLYRRDFVTRDGLYTVLYEGRPEVEWPEEKILDVQMCKLRRHLRRVAPAIIIQTKWGEGWRLLRDSRAKIVRDLARRNGLDGIGVAPDAPPLAPAGNGVRYLEPA